MNEICQKGDLNMVISGLFIETVPSRALFVAKELEKKNGVEVHHIEQDYKIIITMETDTAEQSYQLGESFKEIDGIITVCLVYSNFEEDPNCQLEADYI